MALRVLLADESSTIKRVMQLALQDFAVEVKSVPVGLDVLPVTKTFKPDIIFADVLLTKRNGYEVSQDLKNDPETRDLPVVLMWSGFMEIDEVKIAVADARLEKPFDADTLRQLVQSLVPKTQSNPVSNYLQFPKMPEFTETPTPAPSSTTVAPRVSEAPKPQAKVAGKIPDVAPVNFDKYDPTVTEDEVFGIPDEHSQSGIMTRTSLPMVDSPDVDLDEEFTSVPLKSSQQRDQHEEDGWTQQDLKQFKIQVNDEKFDDDFASKFVIPQEELDSATVEDDGEFEELHFANEPPSPAASAVRTPPKGQTPATASPQAQPQASVRPSPKAAAALHTVGGADREMIERVIREEAREVIENICWKVLPELAERIVREEINKILRDVEK
jgi:two-component system cell cycle response regulator